eukprot:187321-Pelagomonas_calceolata.AAC.1
MTPKSDSLGKPCSGWASHAIDIKTEFQNNRKNSSRKHDFRPEYAHTVVHKSGCSIVRHEIRQYSMQVPGTEATS